MGRGQHSEVKEMKKLIKEVKVAIFLATGFEEVEALTTVDLLRRVGIQVDMVSISLKEEVSGGHGIVVKSDCKIEGLDFDKYDALILPGGMPGTINLGANQLLMEEIWKHNQKEKLVAAICAAPSLLGKIGILKGKNACCYPGFENELLGANVTNNAVESDANIITSRGVGTAIDFALAIIKTLADEELSNYCAKSIIARFA
jgi:4-methyl-5(b-hydroxyethyl)-thiazole monophosphate biosynthesis